MTVPLSSIPTHKGGIASPRSFTIEGFPALMIPTLGVRGAQIDADDGV